MMVGEGPRERATGGQTKKYDITQKSEKKIKPPIRWAATRRALAFALFTLADDCKMSHTLIAPTRTNVIPSHRLSELLIMFSPRIRPAWAQPLTTTVLARHFIPDPGCFLGCHSSLPLPHRDVSRSTLTESGSGIKAVVEKYREVDRGHPPKVASLACPSDRSSHRFWRGGGRSQGAREGMVIFRTVTPLRACIRHGAHGATLPDADHPPRWP